MDHSLSFDNETSPRVPSNEFMHHQHGSIATKIFVCGVSEVL